MTKSQLGLLGSVLAAGALAIAGCGGGGGGGGTGGRKADGGTGGKGTGGSGTGGRSDGGTGGAGTGGRADGGTGGVVVVVDGGDAGPGDVPAGDTGSDAAVPTVLYDFEPGVQGWSSGATGATVAVSTDQHVDGVQSLKYTLAAAPEGGTPPNNVLLNVNNSALWPGTVVTFNAFFPVGTPTDGSLYFQAFSQYNNYQGGFEGGTNSTHTIMPGAFTTWTYTVPNTFPGGLQVLGFQTGDNAGGTLIAGKSIYLDNITATGGVQNCAVAIGTGAHDFEPNDAGTLGSAYGIDGFPSNANIAISLSTDQAFAGTGSMKVAFTGLTSSSAGQLNTRNIFISSPNVYCGQVVTFHVFMPTGSEGLIFQAYTQYNGYARFTSATGPTTITRNAFNTYSFTVPSDVGPGGIQRIGLQFINNGPPASDAGAPDGGDAGSADGGTADGGDAGPPAPTYTGNVYVDNITW